jgi:outer membrane receptor protein involved in Fe transport
MDTSDFNYITNRTERNSFAGSFNHSFNDTTEFYSFFSHSDSKTTRADDGYNQSRGPTVFLAPPNAYARNPAYGGNAIGQTLELGFFAPEAGLTRPTLADMPNMPLAGINGGPNVAMYQGVRDGIIRTGAENNITETSTVSVQAGLKGEFDAFDRTLNYDVSYSWGGSSLEQQYKTFNRDRSELAANGLGGPNCTPNGRPDFDFAGAPGPFGGAVPQAWDFYAPGLVQTFFPGFIFTTRENLSYALTSNNQGQGDCMFYNPYLSQLSDPNLANSRELMDWMNVTVDRVDKRNKLAVFDAVVSGELMEMRGGMAQFAIGGQYRERNTKEEASELHYPGLQNRILTYDENGVPDTFHRVSNNYECAMCAFNYNDTRTTKAAFMELSLPFIDNVETQIALRFEDYGGQIGSELSPKIAMSWRPTEDLLVRGSFSQSFRAPNIAIVETGLQSSSYTFRDPISNQAVRAGLLPPTDENAEAESTYTLGGPAPDVGNEYADTYSLGFQWTPSGKLDGLSLGADFWRFEVSDRVLPEPPIRAIQPEIEAFIAASQNESNYVLNDTIPADSAVPYTACSPSAIEAEFGRDSTERLNCVVDPRTYVVPKIQRAFGVTTADLITTTLSAINAGQITADGADITAAYTWSNDLGIFRAGLDYTHVRQYMLKDVPGLALGLLDTGVFDAAGTTGDGNIVRSLPDNRGNLTLSWQRDAHGVTLINRHIGSYRDLAYDTAYQEATDFTRGLLTTELDSYQTWDLQYRYSKDWGGRIGTTNFTMGVLDMFNEDLPFREVSSLNYDTVIFDGRGRRLYARVLWQIQ